MLICLRGCSCNSPFSSSEKSSLEHRDGAHQETFYGNMLLQGGALSLTQLALCPSNCTSLSEEERQRSTLKFALWVQATFRPDVALGLWHCKMSLLVWEETRQTEKG